jgi:hypothetical protein
MTKLESQLVGVAGEYLVAAELTLRGHLASITLRNSRGIDIIASNSNASKSVSIQVKTNSNGKQSWILNKKSETFFSDNHFYVFVAISELGERPTFYIIPSKVVAQRVSQTHSNWLKGKKRDGNLRKDTPMRKFYDWDNEYLECWDLLEL